MGCTDINERKLKHHGALDKKMEEREFHLARLAALWPSIDLLECPLCAQPALDRLITPDPYPNPFYIQHSWPISADHVEQSAISEGRGETRFPRFGDSPPGESIPRVKRSVKHQLVNQPAINPPPGRMKRLQALSPERQTASNWGWDSAGSLRKRMFSHPVNALVSNPDPLSLTPDKSTPSQVTLSLNHAVSHTLTSLKSMDCHH